MPKPENPGKPGNGKPWHADQVKVDSKDGMSNGDDTVVAGEGDFSDPAEYPTDYNWSVKTYGGNDTVDLHNVTGVENSAELGDGNDLFIDSPYNDTVNLGDGNDTAVMTSGMGYVTGGAGDDVIKVYIEQFMNPPTPPSDPGGPFWLSVGGGSEKKGSDSDSVQFYMSADRIDNTQYDEVIAQAFEDWKDGTIDPAFTMPRGELHLGEVTAAEGLDPMNILIQTDVENLQIIKQVSDNPADDVLIYDSNNPIEIA
jgi:Ca2+-binding RTX toxin-like protein